MTNTVSLTETEVEAQIPRAVGYKLLIAMPDVERSYASGIAKAETTVYQETVLSIVGVVVDMGEQAYKDPDRYPTGPWCKVGDYVIFRANSGTRIKANGKEYRFINDDTIDGVVDDPRGLTRA